MHRQRRFFFRRFFSGGGRAMETPRKSDIKIVCRTPRRSSKFAAPPMGTPAKPATAAAIVAAMRPRTVMFWLRAKTAAGLPASIPRTVARTSPPRISAAPDARNNGGNPRTRIAPFSTNINRAKKSAFLGAESGTETESDNRESPDNCACRASDLISARAGGNACAAAKYSPNGAR